MTRSIQPRQLRWLMDKSDCLWVTQLKPNRTSVERPEGGSSHMLSNQYIIQKFLEMFSVCQHWLLMQAYIIQILYALDKYTAHLENSSQLGFLWKFATHSLFLDNSLQDWGRDACPKERPCFQSKGGTHPFLNIMKDLNIIRILYKCKYCNVNLFQYLLRAIKLEWVWPWGIHHGGILN